MMDRIQGAAYHKLVQRQNAAHKQAQRYHALREPFLAALAENESNQCAAELARRH